MTEAELRAIEERAEKATEGPWTSGVLGKAGVDGSVVRMPLAEVPEYVKASIEASPGYEYVIVLVQKPDGQYDVCHAGNGPTSYANAAFIASSRTDVPALIAHGRAETKRADAEKERADEAEAELREAWAVIDMIQIRCQLPRSVISDINSRLGRVEEGEKP